MMLLQKMTIQMLGIVKATNARTVPAAGKDNVDNKPYINWGKASDLD